MEKNNIETRVQTYLTAQKVVPLNKKDLNT